jgi:hypothetical protein
MIFDFQGIFLDTIVDFPDWVFAGLPDAGPFLETRTAFGNLGNVVSATGSI